MSLKLFCLFPVWRKCRSTFLPPFFPPISHLLLTWRKWYTQYSKERGISSIYSANTGLFMATVGFVFLPGTLSTVFWPSAHFTPPALYLTWCFQKHPTPTTLLGATGRHTVGQHTSAIVQQKSGSSFASCSIHGTMTNSPRPKDNVYTGVAMTCCETSAEGWKVLH